jgi:hypothetical protein
MIQAGYTEALTTGAPVNPQALGELGRAYLVADPSTRSARPRMIGAEGLRESRQVLVDAGVAEVQIEGDV